MHGHFTVALVPTDIDVLKSIIITITLYAFIVHRISCMHSLQATYIIEIILQYSRTSLVRTLLMINAWLGSTRI